MNSYDKRRRIFKFEELDGVIFEILFNPTFSIETLNDDEIKLIVKIIEQVDFSVLNEEDDENERNIK